MQRVGSYYSKIPKRSNQVRVFTTGGIHRLPATYHIADSDGRELAMSRDDAVVAFYALGTALKTTKGVNYEMP